MSDDVRALLDEWGADAVVIDTKVRRLHAEGKTSEALIEIARALQRASEHNGD